ncbi:MAG TPA: alpha-L-arabinofuranosidase C-terminal domain-containing protein [Chloroflexota bacterium]|nr:alpha-L-arabinofuranosidase C-terminal domain-containing protein [Chloroflexota bacterium]
MQYSLRLDPERQIGTVHPMVFGHFIEHLGRCIYGGVYEPGSPLADARGFRTDVLEAVKTIGVPILRWPGGNFASNYHWEDGIGPVDKRPARFDLAWRSVEPNTFGTEEFLAFCDALSTDKQTCEPYVCLNTGTGTLDEAVRWLEYCNLDSDQYPTHHARWRRQLGRTEPYRVKYWGIGNEVYGAWQVGHSTAAAYADKCVQYARFLKAVDPGVKLIAVGADDPDWDLEVLKRAGTVIDYLSIHQYWGRDDHYGTVAAAHEVERRLKLLSSVVDVAEGILQPDRPIEISFDEWNVWYRGRNRPWEEFYALKDGLFAAGAFNAMYRQCKRVTMANLAQMVNALGMLHTTPTALVKSPIYHVFDLYANHTGRTVLAAAATPDDDAARQTISANVAVTPYGRPEPRPRMVKGVPYVDAVATIDGSPENPTRVSIAAVNRHATDRASLRLDLGVLTRALSGRRLHLHELTGPDPMQQNTLEHPDAVTPTTRALDSLPPSLDLSPRSVAVLEWVR